MRILVGSVDSPSAAPRTTDASRTNNARSTKRTPYQYARERGRFFDSRLFTLFDSLIFCTNEATATDEDATHLTERSIGSPRVPSSDTGLDGGKASSAN